MNDIHLTLSITSSEASRGSVQEIELGHRRIRVKVPAGIQPGSRVRLTKAASHLHPQLVGDIYLKIAILQNSFYVPQDIPMPIQLSATEAQRGCTKKLTIGTKEINVKIPAGVDEHSQIRLKNAATFIAPQLQGNVYLLPRIEKDRAIELFGYRLNFLSEGLIITFQVPFLQLMGIDVSVGKIIIVPTRTRINPAKRLV